MTSNLPTGVPQFDRPVPRSGYRWWYVDGLSDAGDCGIVAIAFIGSVFSPYYFRGRQRGRDDPYDYCALNVALYSPATPRWAMTERRRDRIQVGRDCLQIGPSRVAWHNDSLVIDVRERSAPFGRALRGQIRVHPDFLNSHSFELDRAGAHVWLPLVPRATIEVAFDKPEFRWRGQAYFDTNAGSRPLEHDFFEWHWSRTHSPAGTGITYAVTEHGSEEAPLALHFDLNGQLTTQTPGQRIRLRRSRWGIERVTRGDPDTTVVQTLEDAPFYARSVLSASSDSTSHNTVHESLSLDRFRKPWVRLMLPFRMPRVLWRR